MSEQADFASALEERRVQLKMSWEEVAERSGITRQGLLKLRKSQGKEMRPLTKRALEEALKLPAGQLDLFLSGQSSSLSLPAGSRPELEALQGGIPSRPIPVIPPAEAARQAREWAMDKDTPLSQKEREEIVALIARAEVRVAAGLPPVPTEDERNQSAQYAQTATDEGRNSPHKKVG